MQPKDHKPKEPKPKEPKPKGDSMEKQTLNELHQLCDDFYTINEDNLTDEEATRLFEIKEELKTEMTRCKYTSNEFIAWANQQVKNQTQVTKSLHEWLVYLCKTL